MSIILSREYLKSLADGGVACTEMNCYYTMTDHQITVLAKAIAELFDQEK